MEGDAALIVFVPLLLPVATAVGFYPVHLKLIMVVNLGIGLLTPPVGLCLLAGATYLPVIFGWF